MLRGLFILSYKTHGLLYSRLFRKGAAWTRSGGRADAARVSPDAAVASPAKPSSATAGGADTDVTTTAAAAASVGDTQQLHERMLRTLEQLLPPLWYALGTSDALADREQVGRLEEMTLVARRVGDVVTVLMGEREHEALLLLEWGRCLENSLRRVLTLPSSGMGMAPEASGDWLVATSDAVSVERVLVERYDELCILIDEMVSDTGVAHQLEPDGVSQLVWAQMLGTR
ncbi:hypothetical protein CDCA_CDCA06G1917 [Cyanidium caldarium]|uniref:Uncharacterized protein n=1 Tax=Cyanidium caldarium TaxID=2771 RepID=A0AAV9IU91_CYACA|nr:hypothetical protein CDCA_CDCA06G1917 [Cyanidium caldarium]